MYNDVIALIKITTTTDDYGDAVEIIERNEVFAKVRSIGMKEKYEAIAVGLKPELVFVLADYYDYDNQDAIEYENQRYSVLRTYKKDTNEIEIVVTR